MATVAEEFNRPGGGPPDVEVTYELVRADNGEPVTEAIWQDGAGDWHTILGSRVFNVGDTPNTAGDSSYVVDYFQDEDLENLVLTSQGYEIILEANDEITPSGTYWKRTVRFNQTGTGSYLTLDVPTGAGTYAPHQISTDTATPIGESVFAAHQSAYGPGLHVPPLPGSPNGEFLRHVVGGGTIDWVTLPGSGVTEQDVRDVGGVMTTPDDPATSQTIEGSLIVSAVEALQLANFGNVGLVMGKDGLSILTEDSVGTQTTRLAFSGAVDDAVANFQNLSELQVDGEKVIDESDDPLLRSAPVAHNLVATSTYTLLDDDHERVLYFSQACTIDFSGTYRDNFACDVVAHGATLTIDPTGINLGGSGSPMLSIVQDEAMSLRYGDSGYDVWSVLGGTV